MRLPINRGIPKPMMRLSSGASTTVFDYPQNVDETYWLTAFFRPKLGVTQSPLLRYVRGDSLALVQPGDATSVKLFSGLPLRGSQDEASVSFPGSPPGTTEVGVWYGYVEVGTEDLRVGNRPFVAGRPDDTFVLPPIHIAKPDPAVLVHTLDPNHVDLVTLHVLLPAQMQLELRFFDGTFRNGQPQYQPHIVRNENESPTAGIEELFFDRHPMRGPGSIQAVVVNAASDDDRAFLYGTVFR